jgi:hypothetical protein
MGLESITMGKNLKQLLAATQYFLAVTTGAF